VATHITLAAARSCPPACLMALVAVTSGCLCVILPPFTATSARSATLLPISVGPVAPLGVGMLSLSVLALLVSSLVFVLFLSLMAPLPAVRPLGPGVTLLGGPCLALSASSPQPGTSSGRAAAGAPSFVVVPAASGGLPLKASACGSRWLAPPRIPQPYNIPTPFTVSLVGVSLFTCLVACSRPAPRGPLAAPATATVG
jgi:hypothetical protein